MKIPLDYCLFENKQLSIPWKIFGDTFPKLIQIESHFTGIIQEFVIDLLYVQGIRKSKKKVNHMVYIPLKYIPNVNQLIVRK